MFVKVFTHLQDKEIKVYSPGHHEGLCKESYVVLQDSGTNAFAGTNKLGFSVLDVIIYHPMNKYSTLFNYVKEVKEYIKEVKDLRYGGYESPVLLDSEKQAYTTSIQYQVQKKL